MALTLHETALEQIERQTEPRRMLRLPFTCPVCHEQGGHLEDCPRNQLDDEEDEE